MLIAMAGLPGTGKSTLAQHLADACGHHPVCCVLVELSQEGNLRGYYRHRM